MNRTYGQIIFCLLFNEKKKDFLYQTKQISNDIQVMSVEYHFEIEQDALKEHYVNDLILY
jgi:hypothetical protein